MCEKGWKMMEKVEKRGKGKTRWKKWKMHD